MIEQSQSGWDVHVLRDHAVGKVQARALILATGTGEYVQTIPGWTTPGVIGLAGVTGLFKQPLIPLGQRMLVVGSGPLGLMSPQKSDGWAPCLQ